MVRKYWNKLDARQKLIAKLGSAVVGGALLVTGCRYAGKHVTEFLEQPRNEIVMGIDSMLFKADPATYMDTASAHIQLEKEKMGNYTESLSKLVFATSEADLLTDSMEQYLFKSNSSKIPVDMGIEVCEQSILSRADSSRRLEHVVDEVESLEVDEYGPLLGAIVRNVGDRLYDMFNKISPW